MYSDDAFCIMSSRGTAVPASLVMPQACGGGAVPLVLLVQSYLGDKDEYGLYSGEQTVFGRPALAQRLAQRGIASLRVEFPGTGKSREPFTAYTLEHVLSDLDAALTGVLATQPVDPQRLGILGWSMGGRIAALFSARRPGLSSMMLWAPAAENGSGGLETLHFSSLCAEALREGQALVDTAELMPDAEERVVRPLYLSPDFFTQIQISRPTDCICAFPGEKRMFVARNDQVLPASTFEKIIRASQIPTQYFDGADHSFGFETNQPALLERVLGDTVEFFCKTLRCG